MFCNCLFLHNQIILHLIQNKKLLKTTNKHIVKFFLNTNLMALKNNNTLPRYCSRQN